MTFEERSDLVLAAAKALYVNGQSTERSLAAAGRLADGLNLRVSILARWGELALQADGGGARQVRAIVADPTGVDMERVASVMRLVEEAAGGQVAPEAARTELEALSKAPPAPTWLFTI